MRLSQANSINGITVSISKTSSGLCFSSKILFLFINHYFNRTLFTLSYQNCLVTLYFHSYHQFFVHCLMLFLHHKKPHNMSILTPNVPVTLLLFPFLASLLPLYMSELLHHIRYIHELLILFPLPKTLPHMVSRTKYRAIFYQLFQLLSLRTYCRNSLID